MERKTLLAAAAAALALVAGGYGFGRARGDAGGGAPRGESRSTSGAARVAAAPDVVSGEVRGGVGTVGPSSRPDRGSTPSGAESRIAAAPFADAATSRAVDSVLVYGVVRATDGEPVANATTGWSKTGEERARYVQADERGAYAAHLPPGDWRVIVSGPGVVETKVDFELAVDEPRVRRDFEVRRRLQLALFALDEDGRPLNPPPAPPIHESPLLVVAAFGSAPRTSSTAVDVRMLARGPLGAFQHRDGPDGLFGVFEADVDPPFTLTLCAGAAPLDARTVPVGAREVRFSAPRAALRGAYGGVRARLLDAETGRPLAARPTNLVTSYADGPGRATDKDGVVAYVDVPAGAYRFEASVAAALRPKDAPPDLYALDGRDVVVAAGRTTDLGDLRLTRSASVSGVVEDAGAAEVAVSCVPFAAARDAHRLIGNHSAAVGEGGRFSLRRAPRERLLLVAHRASDNALASTVADASGGAAEDVRLRFGVVRAVRLTPRGAWPDLLAIDAADGTPVYRRIVSQSLGPVVRLPVGSYRARFGAAERAFEVGAADVELEIGP